MHIPLATYRLQFGASLRFPDAQALIPYLSELGISDLYASPILKATPGSTHGYDVTDPDELNPELGTEEDFQSPHHRGEGTSDGMAARHRAEPHGLRQRQLDADGPL